MRLFRMNFGQTRLRLVQAGVALAAAALFAGCGNNYRPVVTPINPSGPAPQPSSYVVVVSAPSPDTPGIATIVDYSGDSVMAESPIGIGPTTFTLDATGSTGYTINSDHTLTNFPISVTGGGSLQPKNVNYTTLPTDADPVNLFSPTSGLWAADLNGDITDVFTGSPETFLRSIPLAPTPVMVAGTGSASERYFGISQGHHQAGGAPVAGPADVDCNLSPTTVGVNGEVDAIEISSTTISSEIPVGQCPVYAIESSDTRRLFVLNRGSDTITVINTQNNTLDSCTGLINQAGQPVTCRPTLPLSLTAVTNTGITPPNGTVGMGNVAGPVYAEYNTATGQLIVADYDGGTISIIDVSLDEYGNDSATFGTTYTVKVGQSSTPYPASVTVVADASGNLRAYTANQAESTVTIVNLSSHTVEKTLVVTGYPRNVVSTQNSTFGKVYVASPNSPFLTIIRTDQDIVDTALDLSSGNIVDVRVSTQNAVSGNNNTVSRIPGHGQPCNLPPTVMTAPYTLTDCQRQPK
jgi:DNA-binding beta-propeller fold protein YncE